MVHIAGFGEQCVEPVDYGHDLRALDHHCMDISKPMSGARQAGGSAA
jgi:hypothetical protein